MLLRQAVVILFATLVSWGPSSVDADIIGSETNGSQVFVATGAEMTGSDVAGIVFSNPASGAEGISVEGRLQLGSEEVPATSDTDWMGEPELTAVPESGSSIVGFTMLLGITLTRRRR